MNQSLNEEQRTFLRNRLLTKRTSIRDITTGIERQGVNLHLVDREISKQKEVNEAIARIDSNTYGTCHECGINIPFKRLQVLPETRFCIDCEKSLEIESRSHANNPEAAFLRGIKAFASKSY